MQHALVIANRSGVKGPRGDFTKLHNNGIHALHALKQFVSSKRHIHTHTQPEHLDWPGRQGNNDGIPSKKEQRRKNNATEQHIKGA